MGRWIIGIFCAVQGFLPSLVIFEFAGVGCVFEKGNVRDENPFIREVRDVALFSSGVRVPVKVRKRAGWKGAGEV